MAACTASTAAAGRNAANAVQLLRQLNLAAGREVIARSVKNEMTQEKWEEIKSNIAKSFAIEEQGREDLLVQTGDGEIKQGEAEFVIFESPLGRTKLQLQKKPRLEEKQYHFSHRQGDSARVEYKFSETDTVLTFKAYKWDDAADEWREMDAGNFNV